MVAAIAAAVLTLGAGARRAVTLPAGNAAQQWDKIAGDTVVGGGALQPEAFIYLGYVSEAMDRAVNPGERTRLRPAAFAADVGANCDCGYDRRSDGKAQAHAVSSLCGWLHEQRAPPQLAAAVNI